MNREALRHVTDAIKQLIAARTRQREALAAVFHHEYRLSDKPEADSTR